MKTILSSQFVFFFLTLFTTTITIIQPTNAFRHLPPKIKKASTKVFFDSFDNDPQRKTHKDAFFTLIRYKNLTPTFLLTLTGGALLSPSLHTLFYETPAFWAASANTLLIMSGSMVVNDIFDIENDRINHPERPLVTGAIRRTDAILFAATLFGVSEYISITYLSDSMQFLTNLAIVQVLLYTPVCKRVLFLKNVSCAVLVAFSIFYSGIASINTPLITNRNIDVFSLVLTMVFLGSLYNELLMDISDYKGDLKCRISTIPVVFGVKNSWFMSHMLLTFNIFSEYFALDSLYGREFGLFFFVISSPMFMRSLKIQRENYSVESIHEVIHQTNIQLFIVLVFFYGVSLL